MDELVGLLVFIGIISSVFKWVKKMGGRQDSNDPSRSSAPVKTRNTLLNGAMEELEKYRSLPPQARAPMRPAPQPAPRQEYIPQVQQRMSAFPILGEGGSSMEGENYGGSLQYDSTEGIDICDPGLGHERRIDPEHVPAMTEAEPISGPLPFPWHKNALVQGVVMSEILTRPAQRKWGRR